MENQLSLNTVPEFCYSAYRRFKKGEKHITRYCDEDVLLIMLSGILRFYENGNAIELNAGEYYIQKRGLYQQGIEKSDTPYYYYIHFIGDWTSLDGIPNRGEYPTELPTLASKLDILNSKGASIIEKTAVFLQMLSLLRSNKTEDTSTLLARKTAALLQENLKNGISLKEISAALCYSENYIIRTFKQTYSKTPHEYLTALRLNEACLQLKYSDLTINEIAFECGFGSYVNFYKAYLKAYGMPPSGRLKTPKM